MATSGGNKQSKKRRRNRKRNRNRNRNRTKKSSGGNPGTQQSVGPSQLAMPTTPKTWWKKPGCVFSASLAVVIAVFGAYCTGAQIEQGVGETRDHVTAETNRILEEMRLLEEQWREGLELRYDLGYILFAAGQVPSRIIPLPSDLEQRMQVHWDSASVEIERDEVHFFLPDIDFRGSRFESGGTTLPKVVGEEFDVYEIYETEVTVEILQIDPTFVAVIGFWHDPLDGDE